MLPAFITSITVPPETEPVTLDQVKNHCRITHNEDDSWLLTAMAAARQYVEKTCELALITQTRKTIFKGFENPFISLPYGPVQSISLIQYRNDVGTLTTLSSYQGVTAANACLILPAVGQSWPSTQMRIDAVEITYICGYGLADAVPEAIKTAILLLVNFWYEHRSSAEAAGYSEIPFGIQSMLACFKAESYR